MYDVQDDIKLEPLDADNWLKICNLSVSDEQKHFFNIPNIYWIGISRYEEKTELFGIKVGDVYVGLIGGGFDEDGESGYINPLMIDKHYQNNGYAKKALKLMIMYLKEKLKVDTINLGHRKSNTVVSKLYETLGFNICGEDDKDYFRSLKI